MYHLILAFTVSLVLSLPVLDNPLTLKIQDDTYVIQIGKPLPRDASSPSCDVETCTVQKITGGICSCFGDVSTTYSIEGDGLTVYAASTINSTQQSIVHVYCAKSLDVIVVDGPLPEFEIRSPYGCKLGAEAKEEEENSTNSTNSTNEEEEEEEEEEGNTTTPEEEEEEGGGNTEEEEEEGNTTTPEEEEEEEGGGNATTPEEEEEEEGNATTPEEEEEEEGGNATTPEEEEEEGNATNPCPSDQVLKDGKCVKSEKPKKLSTGAIVGIIVGSVAVLAILIVIVIVCCVKGKNKNLGGEHTQLIPK